MGKVIETGIFLVWFTAQVGFVSFAYLMAKGKGRHSLAWTIAAAFCGPLAVLALCGIIFPLKPKRGLNGAPNHGSTG
jgi:hypothetical protein